MLYLCNRFSPNYTVRNRLDINIQKRLKLKITLNNET